ncbi:MAG: sialidase family protein [Planctomycetota bacterium]
MVEQIRRSPLALLSNALILAVVSREAPAQTPQGPQLPEVLKERARQFLASPSAEFLSGSTASALRCLTSTMVLPSSIPRTSAMTQVGPPPSGGQIMVNDPSKDLLTILDISTQSETAVAAFGNNIVVAYNDTGEYYFTGSLSGYSRSVDGGASFADLGGMPRLATGASLGDPALFVDRTGTFYFAELAMDSARPPGFEATIAISKSTDGGQHFGSTVYLPPQGVLPNSFQDKEFLAVDTTSGPFSGNLYLSWTSKAPAYGDQPIFFSRSTDGGASFSTPISISVPGDVNHDSEPAVGPNGEVYVTWQRSPIYSPLDPGAILVAKSVDGGAHFAAPVLVSAVSFVGFVGSTFFSNILAGQEPRIDVNPVNGDVCIVFPANPPGLDGADVFFTRSMDGGSHWTSPVRVNDDATLNDQFTPDLAINQDGVIEVIWYDRRLDPNNVKIDVFRARSVDGGQSFRPNQRVTSTSSFPAVGYDPVYASGNPAYIGDYIDIKAETTSSGRGKHFVLAWADFRRIISTPRGNRSDQDVFFTILKP